MSIKPLPDLFSTETIVAPPVTYEIWNSAQSNGNYSSLTHTTMTMPTEATIPPTGLGGQVLGLYGQSSGKWLAVYFVYPSQQYFGQDATRELCLGVSQSLGAATVTGDQSNFALPPASGVSACIATVDVSEFLQGNLGYRSSNNFPPSGSIVPPAPNQYGYIVIGSDLDNSRMYIGSGTSISNLTWNLGNPFSLSGGLTLVSGATYYPCLAMQCAGRNTTVSVQAIWGAGALPGYSGSWVPPNFNAWHS